MLYVGRKTIHTSLYVYIPEIRNAQSENGCNDDLQPKPVADTQCDQSQNNIANVPRQKHAKGSVHSMAGADKLEG